MTRDRLFFAASIVLAALAFLYDVPKQLGAHPWWSTQVILIGVGAALGVALVAIWADMARILWAASCLIFLAAVAVTRYGKTQFAASFAEDAAAGRMWYFGWIAICFSLFLVICLANRALRPRNS